jgi:Family of unknown function (DUF695)
MGNRMDIELPAPHYTLIKTTRGSDPAIVVMNSALLFFKYRDQFAWHLSIIIECQELVTNGMPAPEEHQVLYALEDEIDKNLLPGDNVVFLARVTCCGRRELSYRVQDPKDANQRLILLVAGPNRREWQYRMEHDVELRRAILAAVRLDN